MEKYLEEVEERRRGRGESNYPNSANNLIDAAVVIDRPSSEWRIDGSNTAAQHNNNSGTGGGSHLTPRGCLEGRGGEHWPQNLLGQVPKTGITLPIG